MSLSGPPAINLQITAAANVAAGMNVGSLFYISNMPAKLSLFSSLISRRVGVLDMDATMLVLIQHRRAYLGSCLAVPGTQSVISRTSGVGIAPLPVLGLVK